MTPPQDAAARQGLRGPGWTPARCQPAPPASSTARCSRWRRTPPPDRKLAHRGRLDHPGRGQDRAEGLARGAGAAGLPGLPRCLPPAAPRPPAAAGEYPRRPRGLGQRPLRRARPAEERRRSPPAASCRCARTPAPPSSSARRASGSGPRATRRRRSPAASTRPIPRSNLRYSQMAPLSMFEEINTGTNLPAQIDILAAPASTCRRVPSSSPRAAGRRTSRCSSRKPAPC